MRQPTIGDYYRLPHGYYKKPLPGSYHGEHIEGGIYIVTFVDINKVELRLISKLEFHGSGRRWIKKSKMTDVVDHSEFQKEYRDDAIDVLTAEFEAVKAGYANVLGGNI